MTRTLAIAVVFTLIVGAFVLTMGISDLGPGPLSAVHGEQPELVGSGSCTACHGAEGQGFTGPCSTCHAEIREQVENRTGFHGTIEADKAKACEKCHLEHLGADNPLVGDRAFARSGFAGARAFQHEGLGFDLVGRHLELDCDACHVRASTSRLHKGERRFLGLSTSCGSCHDDPHEGKLNDCNACHGQVAPFATAAAFAHDKRFPLTGGHARVACQKCHDAELLSGALYGGDVKRKRAVRACVACHESPHSRGYLAAVARTTGRGPDSSCTLCHSGGHESFASADREESRVLHDASGFRLVPPHRDVECNRCHSGAGTEPAVAFADRFPGGRPQSRCDACHTDPHGGQFGTGGTEHRCTDCHDEQHFAPHQFDAARHATTAFPLRGAHAKVACNECHSVQPSQVRRFRGTSKKCVACHESPHAGQLSGALAAESDCQACHGSANFRPSKFGVEQHSSVFPLVGSHLAVGCNTCHKPRAGQRANADGRYPVSVLVFDGTPRRCEECHVDVHDKAFDRAGLPRKVDGNTGCARCHTPNHFELDRPSEFRHGFWTGFELTGAHATAKCDACHPAGEPTHHGTRVMARAANECASCHADPHAGQFRVDGKTDCRRCHEARPGWKASRFDHDLHSRFKLGKQHEKLACNTCHRSHASEGNTRVVRYKPLGTTCRSCHLGRGRRRR